MRRGTIHIDSIHVIDGNIVLPTNLDDFFTQDQIIDLGQQAPQQILTKKRLKDMFDKQIIKQKELYELLGEYLYQEQTLLGPRFIQSDVPILKTYHDKWTICSLEAKLNTIYENHAVAYIGGVLKAGELYQSDQLIYSAEVHTHNNHIFLKEAKNTSIWNIRSLNLIER